MVCKRVDSLHVSYSELMDVLVLLLIFMGASGAGHYSIQNGSPDLIGEAIANDRSSSPYLNKEIEHEARYSSRHP
jgi:hypothetical protein